LNSKPSRIYLRQAEFQLESNYRVLTQARSSWSSGDPYFLMRGFRGKFPGWRRLREGVGNPDSSGDTAFNVAKLQEALNKVNGEFVFSTRCAG